MSGWELALLGVVVLVGAFLQASIGFGLGMLAGPVMALVEPALVPAGVMLLATGVTAATVVLEREHLDLRGAGWALLGRVPGVVAGAALVAVLPTRALSLFLAAVVLFGVYCTVRGFAPRPTRTAVVAAGAASGLMGTATSIGGPPMALVWQSKVGPALRGTMGAFFLVGSVMSLLALTVAGQVTGEVVGHTALLLPAAALGMLVSRPLARRLDVRRVRYVVLTVSVVGAVILIVQQFV
ncbi:hypothetical protein FHR81_003384 [Actinoalloteichus hoggarensis]|uniref:Probable membrane transporter protein n=1 Tax=Actinoalloteichus hoggarensis TaxID=1470176 RepID=A0A221W7X0_9PSEU|nr:sulfite exporter TauE/SafE family protein [Actinoalloteichus hoggarensis]ASO21736.1 Sulfite exporter TauE/SafE [Actinoalloteichus hoggarensis]MBB5922332.1 hypothetical protein [Actinoalloteichus hoggarensis]